MATMSKKVKNNAKNTPVGRHKKGRIIAILVIILVVGIAGTVLALNLIKPGNSSNQSTDEQTTSVDQTDMTGGSADDVKALGSTNEAGNKTPAQYEGSNPNDLDNLTGIITFAGIAEGKFTISVAIDQFITGNCKIVANSPSGSAVDADVDIVAGPSSSFCSYSGPIPAEHGKYNITITLTGANKTGTITGEVEI